MKLENLYSNFSKMTPEEQHLFIAEFRAKRAQDLSVFVPIKRKSYKPAKAKIELTDEEKLIMKSLGLKQKDILTLRNTLIEEQEDKASEDDILKDDTFDLEEEN